LADVLSWIANTLDSNQTPRLRPTTNPRKTKVCILNTFSGIKSNKLNNFNVVYTSAQFDMDIAKIKFSMIYLSGVIQDWFEVGLN